MADGDLPQSTKSRLRPQTLDSVHHRPVSPTVIPDSDLRKPKMRGLLRNFFVFAALSIPSTQAQVVQDDWLAPALPDLSTTITIGETYDIQWTKNLYSWFPQYAPSANITDVDLWITTSESADEQILIQGLSPVFFKALSPLLRISSANCLQLVSMSTQHSLFHG